MVEPGTSAITIEPVPDLEGYTVEWAGPESYILSQRNQLYRSRSLKPPFAHLASIDAPRWRRLAARSRLVQRLLRFMVTNVVPLPNGDIFVTFDKSAGIVSSGRYRPLDGLLRPCRVLRSACAVDGQGNVFFGEYLANNERGAVRVYKLSAGANVLETAYTFPERTIRHVHGIYYDEFSGSLFCLTGDREDESRIIRTADGFCTLEVVGSGDESWRAVSMLFTPEAIYYGTDAEFRTNQIYRIDRKTSDRRPLGNVSGTVFYSKRVGETLFFATTAENAPSQTENVAAIWTINQQDEVEEVAKLRKDRWHPTLFMFGTIHFPYESRFDDEILFSVVGVEGDGRTFRLRPHR